MVTSFVLPIGKNRADLPAGTYQLLSRCISELEEKFFGYNIVAVNCFGFAKSEIEHVTRIMESVHWQVEYHDFGPADSRGSAAFCLAHADDRQGAQLWFSSREATSTGFNHFHVNGAYANVFVRCAKSILLGRHEQIKTLRKEGFLVWPKPYGFHTLTKKQRVLYRRCMKALQEGYVGFYHVPVDLKAATDTDRRAIRTYFAQLGFGLDENYGFYSGFSIDIPNTLDPWQAEGPYVGRPAQILKMVCRASAVRAASIKAKANANSSASDTVSVSATDIVSDSDSDSDNFSVSK